MSLEDFDRRKHQPFWQGLVDTIPEWDRLIDEFNDEVGHAAWTSRILATAVSARGPGAFCTHSSAQSWRGATAACARK